MAEPKRDLLKPVEEWFDTNRVERTIRALEKNGFKVVFALHCDSARDALLDMIPDGTTVGIGGSMTLHQIGFFDGVKGRDVELVNPFGEGVGPEQRGELLRKTLTCDVYLSGSNAVTEEGHLFNIDGTGNRVAAMAFGPKKTVLVCGVNKIVKNMEEARARVWNRAAPMNAKRLNRKTPCVKTGECADCSSPERICNVSVETLKKPAQSELVILLIGENLGL